MVVSPAVTDPALADRAKALAGAGRAADAAALLKTGVEQGDPKSLFTLAAWRIAGKLIPRDLSEARMLMAKAAAAGSVEAALIHAHFLANGTGGPPEWPRARTLLLELKDKLPAAAEQLALLAGMPVDTDGEPTALPPLRTLSEDPSIMAARDFLSDAERRYLVDRARPRLTRSTITVRATGQVVADPVRRSDGTFFGVINEDLVVSAINRRIARISGTDPNQGEPLQILSYGPGGEFRPHVDSFADDGANQRILTGIVYLTDDYEGGETEFLHTGLRFRGRPGELLLFRNVTADGRGDPRMEHAGLPVRSGTKMIATRWIWAKPPDNPPPEPVLKNF